MVTCVKCGKDEEVGPRSNRYLPERWQDIRMSLGWVVDCDGSNDEAWSFALCGSCAVEASEMVIQWIKED